MNNSFNRRLLAVIAVFGVIGVAFGAFGAHFLKSRLNVNDLETVKTGVLYLFLHTITLLVIYSISRQVAPSRWLRSSGIAFITGVILFSGSLFLIGTKSLTGISISAIGLVTPLGGLCFILGWIMLLFYSLRS